MFAPMSRDPLSLFGPLSDVCIRDEYDADEKSMVVDGVILGVLGVMSSVLTTYLLSLAGILV